MRYLSSLPVGVREMRLGLCKPEQLANGSCAGSETECDICITLRTIFQLNQQRVLLITSTLHKAHFKFQEKLSDRRRVIHPQQNSTIESAVRLICRSILTEVYDKVTSHLLYFVLAIQVLRGKDTLERGRKKKGKILLYILNIVLNNF